MHSIFDILIFSSQALICFGHSDVEIYLFNPHIGCNCIMFIYIFIHCVEYKIESDFCVIYEFISGDENIRKVFIHSQYLFAKTFASIYIHFYTHIIHMY